MDEQFDKELKNHISTVFENFEDPSADEGWKLLEEKLLETGKNPGTNWLWVASAAAAVLLIFFGVATLVNHKKTKSNKLSQQIIKPYHPENKFAGQNKQSTGTLNSSNITATPNKTTDTSLPKTDNQLMAKNQPRATSNTLPKADDQSVIKTRHVKSRFAVTDTISPKGNSKLMAKNRYVKTPTEKNQSVKTNNEDFLSPLNKKENVVASQTINTAENLAATRNTDTPKTINNKVIAATSVVHSDTIAETQSLIAIKKPVEKPNTTLFTQKYGIAKQPKAIVKKDNKRIQFGIYEATYFNYAAGSSSQLNVGAGVAADIRLFKNLKLSTGVAIAQNSLDYGTQLPNLNTAATGATLAFNLQSYAPAANTGVAYSLVLKNYNVQLVGLDVPLNLKYEFNPQKNDSYFSMGVSSGTFIHQSYNYQYEYSSQPIQTTVISNQLNSFYFAKTLNVAFGLGYPIGKTNRLIVEPFLKYPLGGLGGEGIRFGASGINLKFDFQSSKK